MVTSALFLCPTEFPVTASNMNYAAVPFFMVIGLCVSYYGIWGRHWFKPGGGVGAKEVVMEVKAGKLDAGGDLESSEDMDEEDRRRRDGKSHGLEHAFSHTPPLTPQMGSGSASRTSSEDEVGFPEREEEEKHSHSHSRH